jgi:hypothetical protein
MGKEFIQCQACFDEKVSANGRIRRDLESNIKAMLRSFVKHFKYRGNLIAHYAFKK